MSLEHLFPRHPSGQSPADAADWVARKLAGEGVDPPGLQQWLDADPAHRAEFDALWALAHEPALLQALAGVALPTAAPHVAPVRTPRRRWPVAVGLAASLALLAVLLWPWLRPDPAPLVVATAPGQMRVLHLDDGSVLTLNGASRVRVQLRAHRREVALEAGEAFFDVAHDARRPFEVTLGATRVRVLGTVFNLARDGAISELSVYSGRVEIVSGRAHRVLAQGMRIEAAPAGLGTLARFDPGAGDWREGWLQTAGIPLSRLVERLNRRSPRPIAIADPAVGALQVSGRFRLDQPEQTLAHLARLYPLRIQRTATGITLAKDTPARR
ncbi:FecR domain-containing protein [Xanthomonas sp. D-109]|uniref:FecR family protein n=1 Tax=Xanthomonas sp. D-109 TaxID=2821274 RepID=UPI001ADA1610|nr:FecR domain-containing protein [Xanthomonas sp. D-109]MBO9880474.1 FecR domain-containing protein [Xanthomonas sp. D-109]